MLKSALFIGCALALGFAGVIAAPAPADASGAEQQVSAKVAKPKSWAANEVHALYNPEKQFTVVDVNDKFLVKSTADGAGGKVQFAFLDGVRSKLGTCSAGAKLKDGEPRTTWLQVSFSKPDAAGMRDFTVRRTLDFKKHERVYRFKASDNGTVATLEPGVTVGLNDGLFVYEQTVGPIGMSGNTKGVRLSYKLADKFSDIASTVELDRNLWSVSTTHASASSAPIYSVNNNAVLAHVAGMKGDVRDRSVVANPTRGAGIGADADAVGLKVSAHEPPMTATGLQVTDESAQLLCIAVSCFFDFQCQTSTDPSCRCHDLDGPGPNLGVCLV